MEISGGTHPILLASLGSWQGLCQLRSKLQDTNSFSNFSDNISALNSAPRQIHSHCLWVMKVNHCNS